MKKLLIAIVAVAIAAAVGYLSIPKTPVKSDITIVCGGSGSDIEACFNHAQAWAKKTGNTVKNFSPPTSATEKLALYRQLFAAKSTDLDVIQIDIIWPGIIKDHLIDLKKYSKGEEANHFPAIVANNTVEGKLLAMPWYTDAGLMYYRKDLLEKYHLKMPQTWDEFTTTAKTVQEGERKAGNADFQGYVFQAKAYEGLSCNALEWVSSMGGGTIVDGSGNVTINNPAAAKALDMAASWIGNITPGGVLNYEEEDARGVFQNGKALFMRNWPYAWSLMQKDDSPVKNKMGIAPLPHGNDGKSAATLGGWNLAVSKYSKNPDAAADLVMYMASPEVVKTRAIQNSFNPTSPALYKDKDIIAANDFMAQLNDVFTGAVPRPAPVTGLKYPEVSRLFWEAAHDVMSKKATGDEAVKKLEGKLNQVKRNKW